MLVVVRVAVVDDCAHEMPLMLVIYWVSLSRAHLRAP